MRKFVSMSPVHALALCTTLAISSLAYVGNAEAQTVSGSSQETAQSPVSTASSAIEQTEQAEQSSQPSVMQRVSEAQKMGENYSFDNPDDRKTFLKLTAELRCPMCQNQNIADSDAMIAHDMRRKVYQLMLQGNSEQDVINYMKERYGDFVYYQPPVTAVTIWLWALPVLFALIMMGVFLKRRKTAPVEDVKAKLAAANKLLKDE